ncbi:MAG: hypothetical protein ACOX6Q_01745 [Candidatus Dojkabacteria bacterium]|jgi:hypothetical protein
MSKKHLTNIPFAKKQFEYYRKARIPNLPTTFEDFLKFKYTNQKEWEEMKKQYRLWRYDKPDKSVAKTLPKPKLTSKEFNKIRRTPLHKRIELSLEEYNDENIFKAQEKDFAQRFTNLGYSIRWIKPDTSGKGKIAQPTNDFVWNNNQWELKTVQYAKYSSISKTVRHAIKRGKRNFMIDLGRKKLTRTLAFQLSKFNRRTQGNKATRILVFTRGEIIEIVLK